MEIIQPTSRNGTAKYRVKEDQNIEKHRRVDGRSSKMRKMAKYAIRILRIIRKSEVAIPITPARFPPMAIFEAVV